jgi:hypothetical protein
MRPGIRFGLSATEKSDIWCRWKTGQSLHEIGRAFDKPPSSIRCLLLPRGGIPPAARQRSRLTLTLPEREDISRGIASGSSIREIARHLKRATSTARRRGVLVRLDERGDELGDDSELNVLLNPQFARLGWKIRQWLSVRILLRRLLRFL